MENLNAEQVKRGLECLNNKIDRDCDTCLIFWEARKSPITHNCRHIILDAALALITSQEQRIKELTEENERLQAVALKQEDTMQMIAQEKQAIYDELVAVKDENEWISVKDRLPDNYRAVLVVCESTSIGGGTLRAIGSYGGGFWSLADADGTHRLTKYMQYIVTNWMELPNLPKGDMDNVR